MGILKSKTLNNGTIGEYWRAFKICVDVDTLCATFYMGLYLSKEASDSGVKPILSNKTFSFTLTVEELQEQNIIDLADAKVLDKANSMIDPLFDLGEPHVFDPDIAGGTII